jgi:hypothetical protein
MILAVCLLALGCTERSARTAPSSSDTADLDDYRWKNRIVLVFTESEGSQAYREFIGAWKSAKEGAEERDLLLFQIVGEGTGKGPFGPLQPAEEDDLRKTFASAGRPFEIVLIGKDGGVKSRSEKAELAELFELIDSMPMRRAEMREQAASNGQ